MTTLKIVGKVASTYNFGYAGTEYLSRLLRTNSVSKSINFDCNSIISSIYIMKKTLTTLTIQYCQIGDFGAESLANILKSNTVLITLNLPSNKIGHIGAEHLAHALKIHNKVFEI